MEEIVSLETLKIKADDYPDISSLSNRPNVPEEYGGNALSADELKKRFDSIPKAVLTSLNNLIDFMRTNDYSGEIKIGDENFKTLAGLVSAIKNGTLAEAIQLYKDATRSDGLKTLQSVIDGIASLISTLTTEMGNNVESLSTSIENAEKNANKYTDKKTQEVYGKAIAAISRLSTQMDNDLESISTWTENNVESLSTSIENAEKNANEYTDEKIQELLGAGELNAAFDTLKEVSDYLTAHGDVVAAFTEKNTEQDGRISELKETVSSQGEALEDHDKRLYQAEDYYEFLTTEMGNNVESLSTSIENAEKNANEYTDEKIDKILGNTIKYVSNDESKRIKTIPSGVFPFAYINKIGGNNEIIQERKNIASFPPLRVNDAPDGVQVTFTDGVFSVTIPPNMNENVDLEGCEAYVNPYVEYTISPTVVNEISDALVAVGFWQVEDAPTMIHLEFEVEGHDEVGDFWYSVDSRKVKVCADFWDAYESSLEGIQDAKILLIGMWLQNRSNEVRTVKFSLSIEPKIENIASAPVSSVISLGRNLIDDEYLFDYLGFKKQDNGYWRGNHSTGTIYVNEYKIPGRFGISFSYKVLSGRPMGIQVHYTDGTISNIINFNSSMSEYETLKFPTHSGKDISKIMFSYREDGEFEIKDLMINVGASTLPYERYNCFEHPIIYDPKYREDYGEKGNYIDFDELKYIRTHKRLVLTGEEDGWERAAGNESPYMYYIDIPDKLTLFDATSPSMCNYFTYAGAGDDLDEDEIKLYTFTEWYNDNTIGFYTDIPTLEEWKQYLACLNEYGAPLTVLYEIESETTPISNTVDVNPINIANARMVIFNNNSNLDMPNTIEYVKRTGDNK